MTPELAFHPQRWLEDFFAFELCDYCGKDADEHLCGPDPFGHPHAWCLSGDAA